MPSTHQRPWVYDQVVNKLLTVIPGANTNEMICLSINHLWHYLKVEVRRPVPILRHVSDCCKGLSSFYFLSNFELLKTFIPKVPI
eukprot:m.274376 g.274376  ORF g.274376 m.274376 type:complete len:85 (+) comp69213_c0_seq1:158-412(+)